MRPFVLGRWITYDLRPRGDVISVLVGDALRGRSGAIWQVLEARHVRELPNGDQRYRLRLLRTDETPPPGVRLLSLVWTRSRPRTLRATELRREADAAGRRRASRPL